MHIMQYSFSVHCCLFIANCDASCHVLVSQASLFYKPDEPSFCLRCVTDGLVTGRTPGPWKACATYLVKFSSRTGWGRKPRGTG